MKILITGGTGMVGSAFKEIKSNHDLILVGSKDYDLIEKESVYNMIEDASPDAIIHLAAKVGGVKGNTDFIADYFYENILINTNVLNAAKDLKIPKVLSLLSTCIYPDDPSYPLTEDQIHDGEPHKSNFGYAYAKRMLEVHSRAIRSQYGLNYITAVPNNIYGPCDNFDLNNSHVVPAMIRKIHESKTLDRKLEDFWGSGKPLREFTYSKNIAEALILLVEKYEEEKPINIGNTTQITIRQLAETIKEIYNLDQEIVWDTSKPEGQYKKPSSNNNFIELFPDFQYTSLKDGLQETIDWFKKEYPDVRGVN